MNYGSILKGAWLARLIRYIFSARNRNMMQNNTDVRVDITADDFQAVMQSSPLVTLQVQNRALMRKLGEAQGEIIRLTEELEQSQNGKANKESKHASSTG